MTSKLQSGTNADLYRTLIESSQLLVWRCDAEGKYTFLNEQWEQTLGYRRDELLGRPARHILLAGTSDEVEARGQGSRAGVARDYDASELSKDGREVRLHFRAVTLRDAEGRIEGAQGTAEDVTERRLLESYWEAGREILEVLNEPRGLRESIEQVLETLRSRTGCDAVAIRLQDGEDFPYFVQTGFSGSFMRVERSLLHRGGEGTVCRGPEGNARLECTCGLVISGWDSPPLTPRGSFWTNDSAALLDLKPEEDPRLSPRNRCIHHGYASVALVPIRSKGRIVGLMQLNDRRKGRFTAERVEVLEGVAAQIGEALMRKQMEEALRTSEQKLREYQERLQSMAFDAAVVHERERRSIAVDLHDSIGQVLALAQIKLTGVREETTGTPRAAIDEVVALLRQAIHESRSLTFALSPPILYDLGLDAAISWLIEDVEKKHGMQVVLTVDGASRPLDETTSVIVFRAVRELLMNVLKHARSMKATISVRGLGEHLEVIVEDAGVGFDPEAVTSAPTGGAFGLFSLREQICRVGGSVEIKASKGQGTTASVRVPLRRPGGAAIASEVKAP